MNNYLINSAAAALVLLATEGQTIKLQAEDVYVGQQGFGGTTEVNGGLGSTVVN